MAKIAGVDVLLEVQTGTDQTTQEPIYKVLGGQSGATLNRSAEAIDVTSKDSQGWTEAIAGIKSFSIECEGFLSEDDEATGALEEAFDARTSLKATIKMPSGKKYEGTVIITDFPVEFPQDDAVTYSLELTGTGALTVVPAV
jgi:TP901-1 family phage major tail protein